METIKEIIDRVVEDGVMSYQEHETFMNLVHKDGQIDAEESEQISRIFVLIRDGKLKVLDEDRESSEARKREQNPPKPSGA